MARGLLISFAGYPVTACSLFPDNGLASLAGALLFSGHEVKILDFNTVSTLKKLVSPERTEALSDKLPALFAEPSPKVLAELFELDALLEEDLFKVADELASEIAIEIEKQNSNFIGFKLWSGHGFLASLRMARYLRDNFPDLKIYAGGPAVLYSEETIFSYTNAFDAIVDGEGEVAIVGLAEYADNKCELSQIPNLIINDKGKIYRTRKYIIPNINELAMPVYHTSVYPSLAGNDQIKIFILDESRGCPMGCAFCIHKHASGNTWRTKNLPRILDEINEIYNQFNVLTFRFGGSSTSIKTFYELSERICQERMNCRFSGFLFPKKIPFQQLEIIASAGCKSIFLGIESFADEDIRRLGKRMNPNRAQRIVHDFQRVGIIPGISLIVPLPGQTESSRTLSRDITINLCSNLESTVMVTIPALLPRTEWWLNRQKYGFELLTNENDYRQRLAAYKIRRLIPATHWEPLLYKVDNMNFHQYSHISEIFQRELINRGIIVNIQDESILLANVMNERLKDLKDRFIQLFFTFNVPMLSRYVEEVNRQLEIH